MKRNIKLVPLLLLLSICAAGVSLGCEESAELAVKAAAVYDVPSEEKTLLIPCGTPFGIKLLTDGVVVTDFGCVDAGISQNSPAQAAGVRAGDIITRVNGTKVSDSAELSEAVQRDSEKCLLTVTRGGESFELTAKPQLSPEDGLYKLGLWTRDSCAGIGTMTFYDPAAKVFGGLGHSVSDVSTGLRLPLLKGEITSVSITDVLRGSSGSPGELCGAFVSSKSTGSVEINGEHGIFGHSDIAPILGKPVETAKSGEVVKGKAAILTTIAGMMPEEYEIEIVKIDSAENSPRNMTIRVTDSRLLSGTGGIVQGMSGSPVLQNGKLIGAVTHVLVNDPAMGYAVFIENMLDEAHEIMKSSD